MISSDELRGIMNGCTGTEQYHQLTLDKNFKATDGIALVAELAGAFWLVDAIRSYQYEPKVKEVEVQFWTLDSNGHEAVLYMRADEKTPIIVTQQIPYTDFPQGMWEFWVIDSVILLPSEY